jgi:hypothetical protein
VRLHSVVVSLSTLIFPRFLSPALVGILYFGFEVLSFEFVLVVMVFLVGCGFSFLSGFGHFVMYILECFGPLGDVDFSHSFWDGFFGSFNFLSIEIVIYVVYVPSLHGDVFC